MTAPYSAWIIAPEGRGTSADLAALRDLIKALDPNHTPHKLEWLAHDEGRVSDAQIQKALDDIARHDGPRLVWIVGDAVEIRHRWHLKTNLRPGIRLRDIWEDLNAAAESKPAHPIIAIVDVCHAADGLEDLQPNLVAFAACADNETARADDAGGWLTRTLCGALTSLPGSITVHALQGHVDHRRIREGHGEQRPQIYLGHHTGFLLNRRDIHSASTTPNHQADYLDVQDLNALVEACKHLGLCELERLALLRKHLDDVRFHMESRSTALLQLKEDLVHLNRLPTPPGQMPQLAIWIDQARVIAGRPGTTHERLLVRLRNRVQGRKETLTVRFIAPPDCAGWAAQLGGVLGTHPDFDFNVGELRPGELADLVFIILGARTDAERAQLAEHILKSKDPPPLLLIQCGGPDWEHLEEAQTIRALKEAAGNLARATTIPDGSSFAEVVDSFLPKLVAEVEMPRDERRRRADRVLALANLGSTVKWADEGFERANQEAQAAFDAEDYDEALRCYRTLHEKLRTQPTGDDQHRLAQTKVNIACTLANQQQLDAARAELDALSDEDVSCLRHGDTKALSVLAGALVMVERVERARRLIEEHDLDGTPRHLLVLVDGGGRAPAEAEDSVLSLAINQALLDTRMDHAARDAVRLMTDGSGTLSILLGLHGAIRALEGSVIWAAVQTKVAIEYRETLVERILATLDTVDEPAREPHRGIWETLQYSWSQLTFWGTPPSLPASLSDRVEIVQLPWLEAQKEAFEHMIAGRREESLQAARKVAKSYPDREPCQRVLAFIALDMELHEECLLAAKRAFELLPVPRNRALLATALLGLKRFDEAWSVAEELKVCLHPEAARIYAIAAHNYPSAELTVDERVAAWYAYLKLQPDHYAAWLGPVDLYQRAGRIDEAQNAALEALEQHDFDVDTLASVAQLLMLKGDHRGPLLALMKRLRNSKAPQAEQIRFNIAHRIGQATDYEPNWDALIASGVVRAISLDEATDLFLQKFKAADAVATVYSTGRLSAVTAAELTGSSLALLVERALSNQNGLSLALAPGIAVPISDDEPEQWLADGLTLNIMAAAGLLPTLKGKLQVGHRLLVFENVSQRIDQEALVLGSQAEPSKFEALRELREFLNLWCRPDSSLTDDEALAAREEATVLSWAQDEALSPSELARLLIPWLDHDSDAVSRLEHWADSKAAAELPTAVVLGDGLWQSPRDTLDLLLGLQAAGRAVHLTYQRLGALNRAFDEAGLIHRAAIRATELMEFVRQARAAGWLSVASLPKVDIPPPGTNEFLNQAFGRDLAYRAFLKGDPRRRWIGSDFLPFAWFSGAAPADLILHTGQWTRERWAEVKEMYANVTDQLITLDAWAVYVDAPGSCLDKLLSLGFIAALDIAALRRFERRGLGEPKVAEVFGRLEAMATNPQHAGADTARLALALRYATGIRSVWLKDGVGQSWSAETRLSRFLLDRLEGPLSTLPGSSGLLVGLWMICWAILDSPERAVVRKNNSYIVSHSSSSGRLAHCVMEWARERPSRVASVVRVIADVLWSAEEAHRARLPILINLIADPLMSPQDAFSVPPVLDSASIAGALWRSDLIDSYRFEVEGTTVTYRDMFAGAIKAFPTERPQLDTTDLRIGVPVEPIAGARVKFWSAAEALLLRSPPGIVQTLARDFALWIATSDGQLAALARQLAEAPEDPSAREAFARHALLSPWRFVRREPSQFLHWGSATPLPSKWPSTVADLRRLLSETVSVADDGIWSVQRIAWLREQPAGYKFVGLWGEVPGNAVRHAAAQLALFTANPLKTFSTAQAILAAPDEHPAGRLVLHLLIGRLLTARHGVLTVEGTEIDLKAWLTKLLPKLVLTVCLGSPTEGSDSPGENGVHDEDSRFSEAELDLLEICRFVLVQFPDINSTPAKEVSWLLFRLYSWLIHQLEALAPNRRAKAISALRAGLLQLPANEHRWQDAFDPRRFAGDPRRYRSLVFLHGLLDMEPLASQASNEQTMDFNPMSEALLDQLAELAERPMVEEELQASRLEPLTHLEWAAPVAVPELALQALIQFDATRWSRLAVDVRSRWFHYLSDVDRPSMMTAQGLLCGIIAANAESMTVFERQEAREWLDAESSWTTFHINAWLSLALEVPLELNRAEDSIHAVEDEQFQVLLFSRLLRIHWRRTPEQIEELIQAQIHGAQAAERDSTPLIAAIATLLDEPDEELPGRAATILRDLVYQEAYRNDERLNWVREKVAEQP